MNPGALGCHRAHLLDSLQPSTTRIPHLTPLRWIQPESDFPAKVPGLEWAEYFRAAGLDKQSTFIVWQPSEFTGEAALVASTPLEDWKDWLAFHTIEHYTGILPKTFADDSFPSGARRLTGSQNSSRAGSTVLAL